MERFLEIRNATVWRGENPVFRGFSLNLDLGESVAILGPNGAGKSTLIGLLTGEFRPEANPAACCRLFGGDLYSLWELRHRIGMVRPDDLKLLDPGETARDVILSSFRGAYGRTRGMRFSQRERTQADEVMSRLGVGDLAEREFGTLSSGEKQRFLIGRALVHDPEVLVLDEPSSALDFAASIGLIRVMRELISHGHTLVLVTHHPGEIPPEVGRVVLLDHGRVFADGPKRKTVTSSNLSALFRVRLKVSWPGGWCDVRPA